MFFLSMDHRNILSLSRLSSESTFTFKEKILGVFVYVTEPNGEKWLEWRNIKRLDEWMQKIVYNIMLEYSKLRFSDAMELLSQVDKTYVEKLILEKEKENPGEKNRWYSQYHNYMYCDRLDKAYSKEDIESIMRTYFPLTGRIVEIIRINELLKHKHGMSVFRKLRLEQEQEQEGN